MREGDAFSCTWSRDGSTGVMIITGHFRGRYAVSAVVDAVQQMQRDETIHAIVTDMSGASVVPTSVDVIQMARAIADSPGAWRIRKRAIVVDTDHPVFRVLHRLIAAVSTIFPERRIFVHDRAGALRWANSASRRNARY